MARIRSVHPGLFTDEAFLELSMAARVLLIGIWTECDDAGLFEWKPIRFKMRILPADNADVVALMDELDRVGVIRKFEDDGKSYGAVRNFCKWQRPKSPQMLYPIPAEIDDYVGLSESRAAEEEKPSRGTALGRLLHERQDGTCFYCESDITFYRKKPNSLEIDHRVPVSRGGSDDVANLVATCRQCNSLKANMTDEEFRGKFAPPELRDRHISQLAKDHSHSSSRLARGSSRGSSQIPKTVSGEMPPQREEGGGKEKASLRSDKSRGSRLAEDWRPSPDEADYAANLGMSPSLIAGEIENFRDFWRAKAGAGGIKLDWPATWRTWVRKTCERRGIKPPAANGHGANGAAERTYDPRNAHDAQLMLNIGRERGLWDSGRFGPKPGELGCLIPETLIKPGDGDGWDEWAAGIAKGK